MTRDELRDEGDQLRAIKNRTWEQSQRLNEIGRLLFFSYAPPSQAPTPLPPRERGATGLGDMAESFFTSLGITEERYKETKKQLGLDPTCDCKGRREWLNKMGEKLGVDSAAAEFGGWLKGRKK